MKVSSFFLSFSQFFFRFFSFFLDYFVFRFGSVWLLQAHPLLDASSDRWWMWVAAVATYTNITRNSNDEHRCQQCYLGIMSSIYQLYDHKILFQHHLFIIDQTLINNNKFHCEQRRLERKVRRIRTSPPPPQLRSSSWTLQI